MRGEYSLVFLISSVIFGSSPHAWGIRTTIGSRDEHERFIPTCVGNTQAQHLAGTHQPVHPHVRGEYASCAVFRQPSTGSSPRAWGIHRPPVALARGPRFIPTCVGNTPGWCAPGRSAAVHPHVRGEYSADRSISETKGGSSPRAWGILQKT